MDQESIVLEIDGRSVLGVIKQANQAVEGWEKGTVGAGERMQKSLERMAEMLLKVNDKSYNSMERLTQSIEKQASAYGRTPIERLVAQRDRLVKKLGDEQGMVERVTKAYERMIEVEQKKGGSSGGVTQAIQEIVGKNSTLGGLAGGFAGGFAFEAIKDTVTEVGKSLYEMANKAKESAMELHELSERSGVSVTQLGALKATMEDVTGKSDGFEQGIARMARSITAATQGSTKQVEAYRELGVSADFVKQHHNDVLAIMEKISEHMEKSKTPLQDYANLQLVMRNGAAAYYSVLKEGPNALRDLVASHKELGDAIEANTGPARELNKVQQDLHHMWQLWTAQSLPLVVSTLRWVTDALLSARAGWELFLNDIEHGMMTLAARLQQAQAMMSAAMKGDMQGVNAARDVYNAAITINTGVMQNRQRDIMTQYTQDLAHLYAKPPENHAAPTEDIEPENAKTKSSYEDTLAHRQEAVKSYQAQLDALRQAESDKALSEFGQFQEEIARLSAKAENEIAENNRKFAAMDAKKLAELNATTREESNLQVAIAYTKELQKQGDELKKQADLWRERGFELDKSLNKNFSDEVTAGQKKNDQSALDITKSGRDIDAARRSQANQMSNENEQFAGRVIRMQGGRSPEEKAQADTLAAAVEMAMERQRIEKQIADIQADASKTLGEKSKEISALRMTEEERLQKFQEDGILRLMELQKQRFDQVASKAEGLAHTLFTNPKGFDKQLKTTLRDTALKPAEKQIGDMVATVLVGKSQPTDVLGATNSNTQATMSNTAAIREFTNFIALRGGGGGGSFVPSSTGLVNFGTPIGSGRTGGGMPFSGGYSPAGVSFGSGTTSGSSSVPLSYFGADNPAYMIGPGGTAGFAPSNMGGVGSPLSSGGGGGFNLGKIMSGGGSSPGGGFGGFGNLKSSIGIGTGAPSDLGTLDTTPAGMDSSMGAAGGSAGTTSFGSVADSPLAGTAGMMLAQNGLLGSHAGTWGGIAEGTAGGALLGFQYGGPIGAAVGALAGFGIGLGEKLAGVETPEHEATRLVKDYYKVNIDGQMAKQIVSIANQKYASHVSLAVRSPEVRQMLGLYASGTGQNMPQSAMTPHGGALTEQGGQLYQEATYQYGKAYAFQSNLPVAGDVSARTYPNPGSSAPMSLSINVAGQGAGQFLAGEVVTPDFVQSQWGAAQSNSNGRVGNSAMMNDPGLIVA